MPYLEWVLLLASPLSAYNASACIIRAIGYRLIGSITILCSAYSVITWVGILCVFLRILSRSTRGAATLSWHWFHIVDANDQNSAYTGGTHSQFIGAVTAPQWFARMVAWGCLSAAQLSYRYFSRPYRSFSKKRPPSIAIFEFLSPTVWPHLI